MNKHSLLQASIALAVTAVSQNSIAAPTEVSLAGQYSLAALPVPTGDLKVSFNFPSGTPDVVNANSFRFDNVAAALDFNGASESYGSNMVAWFTLGSTTGLDFRFFGVFAGNDYLQMIVYTPTPMYVGSTSSPSLNAASFSGLNGGVYYYPNLATGGFPLAGSLSNASYLAASPVPESSQALLLLLGLPALAAVGIKRRAGVPGPVTTA